jgi:hypothetical protein
MSYVDTVLHYIPDLVSDSEVATLRYLRLARLGNVRLTTSYRTKYE